MANCPNCRKKLGCSCKLRKAADGTQCCVSCVTQRNNVNKQKTKNAANRPNTTNTTPILISATAKQKE